MIFFMLGSLGERFCGTWIRFKTVCVWRVSKKVGYDIVI